MLYSYTVICLYISVYGYVGCFHFFAITNKVAMAVYLYEVEVFSLWDPF